MRQRYVLDSEWSLPATPPRCADELQRMLRDGSAPWWPGMRIVPAIAEPAVGTTCTLIVRSPLGYRLRVDLRIVAFEPHRLIAASADGDLRGRGSVEVEAAAGGSVVRFHWDVVSEPPWMNVTAFALRPLFLAAHARVMARGQRGLRAVVGR